MQPSCALTRPLAFAHSSAPPGASVNPAGPPDAWPTKKLPALRVPLMVTGALAVPIFNDTLHASVSVQLALTVNPNFSVFTPVLEPDQVLVPLKMSRLLLAEPRALPSVPLLVRFPEIVSVRAVLELPMEMPHEELTVSEAHETFASTCTGVAAAELITTSSAAVGTALFVQVEPALQRPPPATLTNVAA